LGEGDAAAGAANGNRLVWSGSGSRGAGGALNWLDWLGNVAGGMSGCVWVGTGAGVCFTAAGILCTGEISETESAASTGPLSVSDAPMAPRIATALPLGMREILIATPTPQMLSKGSAP
jgi:hypothetical protein